MIQDFFHYAFLQNALLSACSVALCASIVGYFLIAKGMSFAAHALPNIGFAGAMGSFLLGIPPFWGLVTFSSASAVVFSFLGKEIRHRDQGIGVVMTLALGFGALFLGLYRGSSARAYGILFGSVLGVSRPEAWTTLIASLIVLGVLALLYRPLLFSTMEPDSAEAKGVPVKFIGSIFLLICGCTAALAVPITGTLLVFTLIVGPAASARILAKRPESAILLSIILAEVDVLGGLFLAVWQGTIPVGFFVTALSFLTYISIRIGQARWRWTRS